MVRALPLELEQLVIAYSLEHLSPLDAHQARVLLSLVCRAWRDSVDCAQELIVVGNDNVAKAGHYLTNRRRSGDHPQRIKSIYVKLQTPGSRAKAEAVARLLSVVPNVERVQLVAKYSSMKDSSSSNSSLGQVIISALETLNQVVHFSFGEDRKAGYYPRMQSVGLARLVTAWPSLKSINLEGCNAVGNQTSQASAHPWAGAANLRRLELGPMTSWSGFSSYITDHLPSSLTVLVIHDDDLYSSATITNRLAASLAPLPAGIRSLVLLDDQTRGTGARWAARGALDSVIASGSGMRELKISPCAVSDLSTSLAPLANLTELTLVQGRTGPGTRLGSAEVAAFIDGPSAVEKVSVSANIVNKWNGMGQRDVCEAARTRSVRFEVI